MITLLVLGGSGRTGKHVLTQAVERGHRVRALGRNPDSVSAPAGVELVAGTPSRIDDIRRAADGVDAVVSALNNSRASDNPWAKPVSPPMFMTDATRDTLTVMNENGIRRLSVASTLGAGDSWRTLNPLFKGLIKTSGIRHGYTDHHGVDEVVRASDAEWVMARSVALTDAPPRGPLRAALAGAEKPGLSISRVEVARFLLDALQDDTWLRQAPLIWNQRAPRDASTRTPLSGRN
ncbi:NAD(P)-dependent oxidoreductase [Microbacterium testaceum]|uniref:Epimerase n=1 Tax=Microbacterium testaceum TaxID=2033 RepID=A0A147F3M5_MICTE|nr:NAD(P)-binding oxidoreductase [Microbacterium testaceum]KTS07995.1 epimerase [Microbacterium testaceum]